MRSTKRVPSSRMLKTPAKVVGVAKAVSIHSISYFISTFGVVGSWRTFWGLLDLYLYPEDYFMSSMASLVLGLALYLLVVVVRELGLLATSSDEQAGGDQSIPNAEEEDEDYWKIRLLQKVRYWGLCVLYNLIATLAWRGAWGVFDAMFNTDTTGLSNTTAVCLSMLFLIMMLPFNIMGQLTGAPVVFMDDPSALGKFVDIFETTEPKHLCSASRGGGERESSSRAQSSEPAELSSRATNAATRFETEV